MHTWSLTSKQNSLLLYRLLPKERRESYLRGRWPSISDFSQFISLPESKSTMISGINQTLTPHIQVRHCTFSPPPTLPESVYCPAEALELPCARIRQLEDRAGAMLKEQEVQRQYKGNPKSSVL